jgi:uncharacterized membrane protein
MIDLYWPIKIAHVLSSTVLFGTGLGTAFHMWMAHRGGDPRAVAAAARSTVLADFLFTTPAIVVQPATGLALARLGGIDPLSSWLLSAYALYALAGACWIPVVRLQIKARDLAAAADAAGGSLPVEYRRCMNRWFLLGWPAFFAMVAIFWLMVSKPDLW